MEAHTVYTCRTLTALLVFFFSFFRFFSFFISCNDFISSGAQSTNCALINAAPLEVNALTGESGNSSLLFCLPAVAGNKELIRLMMTTALPPLCSPFHLFSSFHFTSAAVINQVNEETKSGKDHFTWG